MIFYTAIIATVVSVGFLIVMPMQGVLVTLMLKPIIDASWNNYIFGVNCLMVVGVALPLLIFSKITRTKDIYFFDLPLARIGMIYLLSNFHVIIASLLLTNYIQAADYFFRIFNGYIGIFMFQWYVTDEKTFKRLLFIMLLAGIFPMLLGIYQSWSGTIWQYRQTALGLVRNVGLYHDAFSFRAYGFQTITAILLMVSYFYSGSMLKKILLTIYGIITCIVIFKVYSKAAIVVFIIWVVAWAFLIERKAVWLIIIPIMAFALNYGTESKVYQDVESVFSKEVAIAQGTMDNKYLFSGRPVIWKWVWNDFKKRDVIDQFFGVGENVAAHNDYLRILYCNGVFGLIFYIIFLATAGWKLLVNMLKNTTPLNVMGVMVFMMWIVDTIGLVPSMYPSYQWYVWGIIGLALKDTIWLDYQPERPQVKYIIKW